MIEFNTKMGRAELFALNKFHVKNNIWAFLIPILFFAGLGVSDIFSAKNIDEINGAIGFIFFVVVLIPFLAYLSIHLMIKRQLKTSKFISDETMEYFKFHEHGVENKTQKSDMMATMQMKWNLVYKAYETKKYFFIFISNRQSYIIPKASVVTGTCIELTELLKRNLGNKFKIK